MYDVAESVKIVDLVSEWTDLKEHGDITDIFEMNGSSPEVFDVLERLAKDASEFDPDDVMIGSKDDDVFKSKAEKLLQLFKATGAKLFHNDINKPYAAIPIGEHIEVWSLESEEFKVWLNGLNYKGTGKPISGDAVKQVVMILSAEAIYDNPEPITLSVRVAEYDSSYWYDLSNPKWQAVKITTQ